MTNQVDFHCSTPGCGGTCSSVFARPESACTGCGKRHWVNKAAGEIAPTTSPAPRRLYDVHFTVEVTGEMFAEEDTLIEECITALIDDELAQHEQEGKRWGQETLASGEGIKLDDAYTFDVRFVEGRDS